MSRPPVGVIGGGAWGTALAQMLASDGGPVRLWAYEAEVVAAINADHRNPVYLPDARLSPQVTATTALALPSAETPTKVTMPEPKCFVIFSKPNCRNT